MSFDNLGLLVIAIPLLVSGFTAMFYAEESGRANRSFLRAFRFSEDFSRTAGDPDGIRFVGRVAFAVGMAILIFGIIRNFA